MQSDVVLFIGTFSPPITGQSFSFETSFQGYSGRKIKVNKTPLGNSLFLKSFTHFFVFFKVLFLFTFKRVDKVYMTTFSTIEGSVSDIMILFMCRLFKKKTVIHLHGSNFRQVIQTAPGFYRKMLIHAFKNVDKGIVLCDIMREQLDFLLPMEKIVVVPNFYDPYLESIQPDAPGDAKTKGILRVGYLSNLMYSKGILHLITAMEILHAEGVGLELHVAGKYMGDEDMSSKEIEESFQAKLRNNTWIKYHGVVRGEDKLAFYQQIDVFALPTFYAHEAQPISIIEALRAGCLILTTDYRYIPDLVSMENGWLVSIKSKQEIAGALSIISECDEGLLNKMRRENMRTAVEQYSLEKYLRRLHEVLLKV